MTEVMNNGIGKQERSDFVRIMEYENKRAGQNKSKSICLSFQVRWCLKAITAHKDNHDKKLGKLAPFFIIFLGLHALL